MTPTPTCGPCSRTSACGSVARESGGLLRQGRRTTARDGVLMHFFNDEAIVRIPRGGGAYPRGRPRLRRGGMPGAERPGQDLRLHLRRAVQRHQVRRVGPEQRRWTTSSGTCPASKPETPAAFSSFDDVWKRLRRPGDAFPGPDGQGHAGPGPGHRRAGPVALRLGHDRGPAWKRDWTSRGAAPSTTRPACSSWASPMSPTACMP